MSVIQADMNVWFTLQYNVYVAKPTSFCNVSESGWCERLVHITMLIWTIKFKKQCECFRLIWTSRSLYGMSDSGSCKRLVTLTISVMCDVWTIQCQWFNGLVYNVSDSG